MPSRARASGLSAASKPVGIALDTRRCWPSAAIRTCRHIAVPARCRGDDGVGSQTACVSRELLNTAKEMLVGGVPSSAVWPGQIRLIVTRLKAPFGPPLAETDKAEVTLTVDAGAEDAKVKARQGIDGLRQEQILRLTEEALEQGGVLMQEDLARVLGVHRRTIVREVKVLKAEGHCFENKDRHAKTPRPKEKHCVLCAFA